MRTPTIADAYYVPPASFPDDTVAFRAAVVEELYKISAIVTALARLNLPPTHVAPTRPREGDTLLADGTNWNPGAGKGVYTYYNSAWNKLG